MIDFFKTKYKLINYITGKENFCIASKGIIDETSIKEVEEEYNCTIKSTIILEYV